MTFYDKLKTKIINSGSAQQAGDRWNMRFLGIPQNLSDQLSRFVKTSTPRTLAFDTLRHANRRNAFQDIGKIQSEPLTVVFNNDDAGTVEAILISQILAQKGIYVSGFPDSRVKNPKFDVKVEWISLSGEVTRWDLYKQCFITNLIPTDLTVEDNTPTTTTAVIAFDSVEYSYAGETFTLVD